MVGKVAHEDVGRVAVDCRRAPPDGLGLACVLAPRKVIVVCPCKEDSIEAGAGGQKACLRACGAGGIVKQRFWEHDGVRLRWSPVCASVWSWE